MVRVVSELLLFFLGQAGLLGSSHRGLGGGAGGGFASLVQERFRFLLGRRSAVPLVVFGDALLGVLYHPGDRSTHDRRLQRLGHQAEGALRPLRAVLEALVEITAPGGLLLVDGLRAGLGGQAGDGGAGLGEGFHIQAGVGDPVGLAAFDRATSP